MDCTNYRGISLLNVTYKVLAKILSRRLEVFAEHIIGDYQCGFRRGRSTTDHIFAIRGILEKCYEYNIPVHQLFIDFRQAYDSVKRSYLQETLNNFRIPGKLARLIMMTLKHTKSKVKVSGGRSREFTIRKGLKQGDALSCTLFNLVLERTMRQLTNNPGGTLLNRLTQHMAYADDVDLLGRREQELREMFIEFEEESKRAGLSINEAKTKYMYMSRKAKHHLTGSFAINSYEFEKVDTFKYLGSLITSNNENPLEIKDRIKAGNKAYYSLQKLLKSRFLTRTSKKRIYRTILRPVVLYGGETWVMTKKEEEGLNTWERKVLRRIYGPVCDLGEWRIRTNEETYELYGEKTIVAEVKSARLRWLGHIERMPEERGVKKVYRQKPEGRRLPGRPRKRWLDCVEEDLKELGVRGWRRKGLDREEWRSVVQEAKVLNGL